MATIITPIPYFLILWIQAGLWHIARYSAVDIMLWHLSPGNKRGCGFCPVNWNTCAWSPEPTGKKFYYPAAVRLKPHREPTNRCFRWHCPGNHAQVQSMLVKKFWPSNHSKPLNLFNQGSGHLRQIQTISALLCFNFWPTESVNNKMAAALRNCILESLTIQH